MGKINMRHITSRRALIDHMITDASSLICGASYLYFLDEFSKANPSISSLEIEKRGAQAWRRLPKYNKLQYMKAAIQRVFRPKRLALQLSLPAFTQDCCCCPKKKVGRRRRVKNCKCGKVMKRKRRAKRSKSACKKPPPKRKIC